jgi:hypothetical protein
MRGSVVMDENVWAVRLITSEASSAKTTETSARMEGARREVKRMAEKGEKLIAGRPAAQIYSSVTGVD